MSDSNNSNYRLALPPGSVIGSYKIRNVLGEGGFSITYLADHVTLRRQVALKELLPMDLAIRTSRGEVAARSADQDGDMEWARQRFLEEARNLEKCRHPNVIEVFDVFEANGTGYMATSYEKGCNLEVWLKGLGRKPTEDELRAILFPLMDGLERVHATNLLHRDIKPENVYVCTDGRPLLLDFGAAREAVGSKSRPITTLLTPGYAPFEQYSSEDAGSLGPWSDIYSLGATTYRMIKGQKPPEASRRMRNDPYRPLAEDLKGQYADTLLSGIDNCMEVLEGNRPQSIADLRRVLQGGRGHTIKKAPERTGTETVRKLPNKARVVALTTIALAAATGAGFWIKHYQEEVEKLRLQLTGGGPTKPVHGGNGTPAPAPAPMPAPAPAPAPAPDPPPPDDTASRARVRELAQQYYQLANTSSGRQQRVSMYSPNVSYFGSWKSLSTVRGEESAYELICPTQSYMVGAINVSASGSDYVATVAFDYKHTRSNGFQFESGSKTSALTFNGEKFLIDSISTLTTSSEVYGYDSEAQKAALKVFLVDYYDAVDGSNPDASQADFFAVLVDRYDEHSNRNKEQVRASILEFTRGYIKRDLDAYKWKIEGLGTDNLTVTMNFYVGFTKGSKETPRALKTDRIKVRVKSGGLRPFEIYWHERIPHIILAD